MQRVYQILTDTNLGAMILCQPVCENCGTVACKEHLKLCNACGGSRVNYKDKDGFRKSGRIELVTCEAHPHLDNVTVSGKDIKGLLVQSIDKLSACWERIKAGLQNEVSNERN